MKKILLLVLLLSPLTSHLSPPQAQSPRRYAINFESHNGESFNVFIDGEIANRMPQSRVMVNDISDRTHQVVVVLKRPVQKAAVKHSSSGRIATRSPHNPWGHCFGEAKGLHTSCSPWGRLHSHFTSNKKLVAFLLLFGTPRQ